EIDFNEAMRGVVAGDEFRVFWGDSATEPTYHYYSHLYNATDYFQDIWTVQSVETDESGHTVIYATSPDDISGLPTISSAGESFKLDTAVFDAVWKPFNYFYADTQTLRTQVAASSLPIEDFVASESYLYKWGIPGWAPSGTIIGPSEYYGETVFQALVSGN